MTEVGRVTAVIDGDISGLTSALNQARSQATTAVSGIEGQFKSGLTKATTGNWKDVGRTVGSDLVSGITAPLGSLGGAASTIATALGPTGIAATAAVAGAAMIGSAASRSAMEWEAGLSRISKTTGIEKGTVAYAELDSGLKNLYTTLPTTAESLQSVAAAAGSLGIERSSIAGFTEVAIEMGSAFEIPAEEAATAMGKIKGQLKSLPEGATDSAEFARKMGSAVDYVGNNFNATEKDVLDFSTRVAGSMSTLGGSAYEVAGWGGMLSSVFPSAERAAGSFDSLLTQLTTNTDSQAAASELLGISTEEFMRAMSTDPSDTLLRIGSAMEALPADKVQQTAKALGGSYGMDTLVKMVGHTEEWRQAIEDTVAAGEQGTSIGQSFAAGANTAQASFQVLKNSISAILSDIGGPINSTLTPVLTSLTGTFNGIRAIGENLWEPFTTAISPATEAVSMLASGVGTLGGMTLSGLVSSTSAVNTAFQTGKAFVTAFKDELTNVTTSSSTFQTLSGYVEKVGDAFDSLKDKASDTLSGIASWLSGAIPSAISGVTEKLGSMFSGVTESLGLGGAAESVGGAVSGVTGFFSNVYDRAAKELGWKTEEATADGTKKGMEKGAEKAKDGLEKATASAVSAGAESGLDTAYWSWVEQLQSQGIQTGTATALGEAMAGRTTPLITGTGRESWKSGGWSTTATIAGIEVGIRHDVAAQGSTYILRVNGKDTGIKRSVDNFDTTPRADIVLSMLNEAGLSADRGTALDLANKPLQAAQWRLSQETTVTTDVYLDFAKNLRTEMEGAGEDVGTAFAEGIVPDTATIDSRLSAIRQLKLYDPAEAKKQGADNAIAYLEALKDTIESVEAAKAKVLLDPDDENARAELERSVSRLDIYLAENPLTVKIEADTQPLYQQVLAAVRDLSGTELKIKLSELGIYDPEKYTKYAQSEFASWIGSYAEKGMAPAWGTEDYQTLYSWYTFLLGQYDTLDANNKELTWQLSRFLTGQVDAFGEINKLVGNTDGIKNSIDQSNNLLSKTAENTSDMCEAMSEFGIAQEKGWGEMGLGLTSFIGNTADYKAFLETEYERGAYHPAPVELGSMSKWKAEMEEYLGKSEETITFPAVLDTSQADSQLDEFKDKATEEQKIPIQVDDSTAMSAIAAIDAAASRPVTKLVYVQEVGGGGGYGGGYNPYSGAYSGYTGSFTPETGGMSGGIYWLPTFASGDVYVPRPTLAVVGDRPGGEWIGGIDQAIARFGSITTSQPQIKIDAPLNINAPVYGVDDLEAVLEAHKEGIMRAIYNAVQGL
ncbi:MAG TPA: phage tail tape measure protein [Methanothrix sp.]|nr:phage tail tape measure protein [Methanothrix sp.]